MGAGRRSAWSGPRAIREGCLEEVTFELSGGEPWVASEGAPTSCQEGVTWTDRPPCLTRPTNWAQPPNQRCARHWASIGRAVAPEGWEHEVGPEGALASGPKRGSRSGQWEECLGGVADPPELGAGRPGGRRARKEDPRGNAALREHGGPQSPPQPPAEGQAAASWGHVAEAPE